VARACASPPPFGPQTIIRNEPLGSEARGQSPAFGKFAKEPLFCLGRWCSITTEETMKRFGLGGAILASLVFASLLSAVTPVQAKGCLKGAVVGGIAGHMAGHGVAGAAGGCAVGRYQANKRARAPQDLPPAESDKRPLYEGGRY
jgi:hypothetical protein